MSKKTFEVIDNFLPSAIPDRIEEIAFSSRFPWYYVPNITLPNSNPSPGHSHWLHSEDPSESIVLPSSYKDLFFSIIYSMGVYKSMFINQIHQARLFKHFPSPNPGRDDIHIDLPWDHLVCLYYINDSDGDTVLFEDDRKTIREQITPKKGRALFFDGAIPHCSTRPKDNVRAIINFNFHGSFFENK